MNLFKVIKKMPKRKQLNIAIFSLVIFTLLISFVFLIAMGRIKFLAAALSPASMYLSSNSGTYNINDEFDINIIVNTGGADSDAATAVINYDSGKLEVVNSQLTPGNFYAIPMTNEVNGSVITYSAVIDLGTNIPANGTGTLATIKFKAKQAGTASVDFTFVPGSTLSNSSGVAASGNNILGSVTGGSFTISPPDSPLPTVNLMANGSSSDITINSGQSANLSWVTTNSTSCTASGGWSGTKSTSGSESTGALTSSKTYTLACQNGNGDSANDSIRINVRIPVPTVTLKANNTDTRITINSGESATLSWTSTNTTSCTASGAWSGSKSASGTESTGALTSSKTYTLACQNSAGTRVTDSVAVNIRNAVPAPTVTLKVNNSDGPVTINYNSEATLSWTTTNAVSCTASGSWDGGKSTSGNQSTGALTSSKTYTLTCKNSENTEANDSVTINVSREENNDNTNDNTSDNTNDNSNNTPDTSDQNNQDQTDNGAIANNNTPTDQSGTDTPVDNTTGQTGTIYQNNSGSNIDQGETNHIVAQKKKFTTTMWVLTFAYIAVVLAVAGGIVYLLFLRRNTLEMI